MTATAPHGFFERVLHRMAFATRSAQLGLADLEARLFRRELLATPMGRPVFVTGLPRAGTTMLLELLAGCPVFAAHTYRDMPFVLCPLLWRTFTRRFRRSAPPRDRAHGDGIQISLDSPEAFEEMLWSAFCRGQCGPRTIAPMRNAAPAEFVEFFAEHRRKVVALRRRDEPRAQRYLSKNNLNIARLPALLAAVPEATVVVPFRDPVQQAASLLRQHLRFAAIHRQEPFARRYMAAIGHFDFGANLRPIDFDGWFGHREIAAAEQLPFWLEYWLAAHRHLLALAADERVVFVDFAALAALRAIEPLAARLGLADPASLRQQARRLTPLPLHDVAEASVPVAMRGELQATFAALTQRALR